MNITAPNTKPFLKWAGGKRWLIANHSHVFPTKFNRYFEPFLGGGSVYFRLQPREAVLADSNRELIETYKAIQSSWKAVWCRLLEHQKHHDTEYYYRIRNQSYSTAIERAAQFIYLNRTCWNGLYRVNLKGQFNVPKGTKNSVVMADDNFPLLAKTLESAKLYAEDFQFVIEMAKRNDFVYLDPPYAIENNGNGFIKYNDRLFDWNDQMRLFESVTRAKERGVKILLSNVAHKSIIEIYKEIGTITSIDRFSRISGNSKFRRNCKELLIQV